MVCEDADISSIVQTACRVSETTAHSLEPAQSTRQPLFVLPLLFRFQGVWQNMGQNCAGPERFFVYEGAFDDFFQQVTTLVKSMK